MEKLTSDKDFWNNNKHAQETLKNISILENELKMWDVLNSNYDDVLSYIELINEGEQVYKEANNALLLLETSLENTEIYTILDGPDDKKNAILTIHPGAGGIESQDWALMLYRLYLRWCEKNNYIVKTLDFQVGEEAGIKNVSLEVQGSFVYGHLKAERGVHRLVRISPFDSNGKRHTSFASVFIFPVVDDDIEIKILDKDIRIDTYRASGAGGQHVNKTDSAVRITHLESGFVVQCQNERSQLKNKNVALKMLKAKLHQDQMDKIAESKNSISESKKDIGWGSQIRSYVFHPYNLVKDHRTKFESTNIQSVMDGNIDNFIRSYLLSKMEK